MGLFNDIKTLFIDEEISTPARKLHYSRVENVVGWEGYDPRPALPGTGYAQWWLQEMWLANEREWLSHYAPLVYGQIRLQFGDEQLDLPCALGEFEFLDGAEMKDLQDALLLNYPMCTPLPYNGGVLELAAALVAVRKADGLGQIVSAVGELSKVLAVPQLSAVSSVAGPIAKTVDSLFGQGDRKYQLGFHQAFKHEGEEDLREGYFLAAATDAVLDPENLMVNDGRLAYADNPNTFVRNFDYMLFRLEISETRDDLKSISSIFDIVDNAHKTAVAGRLDEAEGLIKSAGYAAFVSDDLTLADRKRLPRALREEFDAFLSEVGIVGDGAAVAVESVELLERLRQTSVDAALTTPNEDVMREIFES